MKHLRDIDGDVHCEGAVAAGEFTLCGLALEGERGDAQMTETPAGIDCRNCVAIIEQCKRVRNGEIKPPFQRRRA